MAVEFEGKEDFQQWLEEQLEAGRPKELAVALAARSALRAVPGIGHADDKTLGDIALPVLRAALASSVAATCPADQGILIAAARSAAHAESAARDAQSIAIPLADALKASNAAANSPAGNAAAAALKAAISGATASPVGEVAAAAVSAAIAAVTFAVAAGYAKPVNAYSATFAALSADFQQLDSHTEVAFGFVPALWHDAGTPSGLVDGLKRLEAFFGASPNAWGFWQRWYRSHLEDGAPLDWALQEAVARIPDADWQLTEERDSWEKVAAHIAGLIERLERQHATRVDRELVRDDERGLFVLEPSVPVAADPLAFCASRIELLLNAAVASSNQNAFSDESYEATLLRPVLENHRTDGSLLAVTFFDACMALDRHIHSPLRKSDGRYPDDPSLINLKNALYATTEELCELDPLIKSRVERLVALGRPARITPEDRNEALKAAEVVRDLTDDEANVALKEDAEAIANSEEPPSSLRARFVNRITTITTWMDRAMKGDKRLTWLVRLGERFAKWWDGDEGE